MGLTKETTGRGAVDKEPLLPTPREHLVGLAGNPNVGKSTLFNALTGLHQHTGNWPGKTVATAQGTFQAGEHRCRLVDVPGTYSLLTHSAEEEVARDFICGDSPEAIIAVCDATCLQRGLGLVLQIMETGRRVILCVNLMDEAQRRHITLDLALLEKRLGVPVVATTARRKTSLTALKETLSHALSAPADLRPASVMYPAAIESALSALMPLLQPIAAGRVTARWLALRLLEGETPSAYPLTAEVLSAVEDRREKLAQQGITADRLRDCLVEALEQTTRRLCRGVVRQGQETPDRRDRQIDRVVTGRRWGYPLMLLLLAFVLWLTLVGANRLSDGLSTALFWVEQQLSALFLWLGAPDWLHGAVVLGAYRMLASVVAVMLPPMAIFFPLFTLLEDVGYLPRVAYNLDRPFARCGACGKQALTMCMGFGCNAAGVVGCRIIDSPRERLLAVLTNSLVPCNGRFPILITVLSLFFIGTDGGGALWAAVLLTGLILLGVAATLLTTRALSATLLRGTPSFFTLELPPYRPPQVGQVLIRSVLDRTLFVLGRAAAVAAPAGLIIWILAHVTVGESSLLQHAAAWLEPLGRWLGMDGVILLAFILALPANEVVLPLTVMLYSTGGMLPAADNGTEMLAVLTANGWTPLTALCVLLFCLFHWPCSTTLLTIRRETGSLRWTALAALLPTLLGVALCALLTAVVRLVT